MMFTVRILFDNVSSLWQSPLHGNRSIANNNRNGLYHQFVKLSIKKYKNVIVGCVWIYMQKVELRDWWEYGDEKTGINQLNES